MAVGRCRNLEHREKGGGHSRETSGRAEVVTDRHGTPRAIPLWARGSVSVSMPNSLEFSHVRQQRPPGCALAAGTQSRGGRGLPADACEVDVWNVGGTSLSTEPILRPLRSTLPRGAEPAQSQPLRECDDLWNSHGMALISIRSPLDETLRVHGAIHGVGRTHVYGGSDHDPRCSWRD